MTGTVSDAEVEHALSLLAVPAPPGLTGAVLARVGVDDAAWAEVPGPTGPAYVAWHGTPPRVTSLLAAHVVDGDPERFLDAYAQRHGRRPRRADPPAALAQALRDGDGRRLDYDLDRLTDFERAVLTTAQRIPRGEVRSYAWVAREIGRPGATRAVGSALGRNPVPVLIPCHRVVRSDGRIEGYAFGTPMKRALLAGEGVDVEALHGLAARGVHYLGSDTTRVFCVPTCRDARRITAAHRVEFRTAERAQAAGYRPCQHCRPAAVPA